ncbi:hypothetical protein L798_05194 [Zootermopsis nevadensis]|uniref:Uncharacterized protein n=1 Tax=Zootermopsis nevadensis TaxID=136037 RepID=A0A067RL88_ZOONE|nr:hypothetical protein L798_05194 [Zootermopsis nevadensis]
MPSPSTLQEKLVKCLELDDGYSSFGILYIQTHVLNQTNKDVVEISH